MKTIFKRATALLLSMLMVFSVCSTALIVYATDGGINVSDIDISDDGVLNYVSIGDSMTNGYGLDGYTAEAGVYDYGYYTYANQFAAALAGYTPAEFAALAANAEQGFGIEFEKNGVTVNHAQLGLSAARPEDVNFLLNLDWENDYDYLEAMISQYPENEGVWEHCSEHGNTGTPGVDFIYCEECYWNHVPGLTAMIDEYPAWWIIEQGDEWLERVGYGDFWTWKELAEDYRFGTVTTYIQSVFGDDAEKAAAAAKMASNSAKPRSDLSNGAEALYVAKHYQEQITNADVVSLGIGNGNFGVWLMGRITDILMYKQEGASNILVYDIDRVMAQLGEDSPLAAAIDNVLAEIDPFIDEYIAAMMGEIEDYQAKALKSVCTYGVVSFMVNYKGMIERILELNPDVKIVLMGLMNTYAGDDAMAEEGQVTIGNILDVMFPPLNAFIASVPSLIDAEKSDEATFYYAEEYEIECLIQNFGDEDFYAWKGVARDRFVTGVNELILNMMISAGFEMGGVKIQNVSSSDVKAYEEMSDKELVQNANLNKNGVGSVGIYLGIEDAICKSGRLAPVTLSTLTTLKMDDPTLLSKAIGNFNAELEKVIDGYKPRAIAALAENDIAEPTETQINDISMLMALPEALSNALWTDTELCSMLAVVARNKLGNGLGAHPSVAGHTALAEEMIAAYNGVYTPDNKLEELLAGSTDVAAIKKIYDYLHKNYYLTENQTWSILNFAYEKLKDDVLTNDEQTKIVKYVYQTLVIDPKLPAEDVIEIVGYIYGVLVEEYAESTAVKVVTSFNAKLEAEGIVIPERQFKAILNKIYDILADNEVTNGELRYLAYYIFCVALPTQPKARSYEDDFVAFDAESKLAIIKAVYSSITENIDNLDMTDPAIATFDGLYNTMINDNEIPEEMTVQIMEQALTAIGNDPEIEVTQELVQEVAKEAVDTFLSDESVSFDKKLEIVQNITNTLSNSGLLDGEGEGEGSGTTPTIPTFDLTVLREIFRNLTTAGYMDDASATRLTQKIYSTLLDMAFSGEQLGAEDVALLLDAVLVEVFGQPGLTLEDRIEIVVIVYNTLENEGLVSDEIIVEKLDPYYQQAIDMILTDANKTIAINYITVAIDAVNKALNAVNGYEVSEDLEKVKVALAKELAAIADTLADTKGILQNPMLNEHNLDTALKAMIELKAELDVHVENVTALANEIGIVSAPYIAYVIETTGYYVNHVNGMIQDAYAWVYTSLKDFAVQYAALVDTIASAAEKVDPALGAAVRKFMNDTPADALAIIYAYGEKATLKLFADAAAAAKEIYTQIVTLAGLLEEHGDLIYEAILADQKCQDLYARLLAAKTELEALAAKAATAPTATALALYEQIDAIKAELADLATEFYYAAISAVDAVDGTVADALADSIESLMKSIGIAGNAAGNYIAWLPGQVEAMCGEVLASIVANWDEFATVAGPIIDQLIITTVEAIKDYVEGVIEDVKTQIRYQIGVLEETLEDLKEKADKQIQAQIEAVEAKIEELKKLLDSDLVKNIVRIGELVLEIKDQVIDIAKAAKDANFDAIADALNAIAADLAEIDEILTEVLGERYSNFIDQIGDLGETVLKDLLDAAIKYAPELADAIYDYLYNNPEKVIAFFNEYGYIITDLAEEYGEEALGVIVVALAIYGEDIADYIIENHEAILEGIIAWAEVHGENTVALIKVYAEALGICDAVQAEIEALEAQLEKLEAQLETAVGEAKKEIEAQIAAVKAKIEELNEKLQILIDSVSNLDEALKELVEAGIAAGHKAVLEAIAALNTAVRDLMDSVSEELADRLENLLNTGLGLTKELIGDLAEMAVESVSKFAPELADEIYNYLYNNPEEVIAFFNEYGDEIVELCKKYGDEVLGVVGAALYLYGDELAEYIVENHETILEGIIAWAEVHGENTVALLQVYAEALGLCDAVRGDIAALEAQLAALKAELDSKLNTLNNKLMEELAALEAQLAALKAELETAVGEAKAQIEAEIAKIEALIAEYQDEIEQIKAVIAEIKAVIAVVEANLSELNEKLQALVNAILNLDDALMYLVEVGVEAGMSAVQSALNAVAQATIDLIGVFSDEVAAQLNALLEQAKAALNEAYLNAIHADYVIDQNSAYVALGDGTINVEAFADYLEQLVAEADLGYAYDATDLTLAGSKISALPEIIAQNLATIATSDLISIGYGYDELAQKTVYIVFDLLLQGTTDIKTDVDWVELVGADAAEIIEEKIAEIYASLIAEGLGVTLGELVPITTSNVTIADALVTAVEYFAYYVAEYAVYMPQVVNAIHEINPDALVMVLAMSNPLSGTTLSFMGNEIAFGDYLDYVADAINVEGVVYAALSENVVFVTATEVETNHTGVTISVETTNILTLYAQYITGQLFAIETTVAGNEYAIAKMIESLNITVTLDRTGILGDVNGDGYVTFKDAILIARYEAGLETSINTGVADVDGDGHIGFKDAILVARYEAGLLETFPASK